MEIQGGEGWRLRVDPARQPFAVLIGAQQWAAELTLAELALFQRGVLVLEQQLAACSSWLMPEETLELEHDGGALWLQLSGTADEWSLRFVLSPSDRDAGVRSRGLEGRWDAPAAAALAAALRGLVLPVDIAVPA